ncbi:hypothetical protein EVAR_91435_1 [Eumeta japonica]|uniref:Uncharacterized protein n=1 Tax=Eumeta variegata TaxID=151549 RepID=A0A4C1X0U5_EUMVA|nr:hypothetical protein EVAR_91435_1 [Eumeta japonica]
MSCSPPRFFAVRRLHLYCSVHLKANRNVISFSVTLNGRNPKILLKESNKCCAYRIYEEIAAYGPFDRAHAHGRLVASRPVQRCTEAMLSAVRHGYAASSPRWPLSMPISELQRPNLARRQSITPTRN